MSKLSVKKGDTVLVIAGKDKDKRGKVLAVNPSKNKVLVEGVNVVSKCKKAKTAQEKSEIIKMEAGIDASNVMVVCPVCGKATRVGHAVVDGKKARICKKCSASLDKEFVKEVKKATKSSKAPKEDPAVKPAKKSTTKKTTTKKSSKSVDEKKETKKSTKKSTKEAK
jgi:large subunit ribosomal protein L24